jgi:opacity protein-like surface antigen
MTSIRKRVLDPGRWSAAAALAALALGAPRWAAAQEHEHETTPEDMTTPQEVVIEEEEVGAPHEPVPAPIPEGERYDLGAAVAAGGGVSDFSRSSAREFINTGGFWELRGVFGTRSWVGLEAAYIGAAYGIESPADSTTLVSNGAELSGRLNLMRNSMRERDAGVQPYALAGVAWKNYQLSGDLETADVADGDNTFEVPVGAGLAFYFAERMMLDARFAYRFAFEDELIQPVGEDEAGLDNWDVTARLGAEF